MLSVEHVTKTYGKFTALEDISLTFTPGVYGLLAPNGAGKTTLIKMLTTLLFPTKGQILWEGEDIRALGAEYRGLLGISPSSSGTIPATRPGNSSGMPPPSSASRSGRRTAALTTCWRQWDLGMLRTKK